MPFEVEIKDRVAELVFNHPPVNAFSGEMWMELPGLITSLGENPELRCILIRAEGKGFCAGVDIKELAENSNAIVEVNKGNFLTFKAIHEPTDVSLPVVVLMDGGSASASEYVSMVLKERGRAVILGSTSLGKGSMQNTYPMPGGGELRVTVGRYVGASGERLPARGITPHRFLPRPISLTALEQGAANSDAWVLSALDILEGQGRYGGSGTRQFGPSP